MQVKEEQRTQAIVGTPKGFNVNSTLMQLFFKQ
jgi:hypothetical protein